MRARSRAAFLAVRAARSRDAPEVDPEPSGRRSLDASALGAVLVALAACVLVALSPHADRYYVSLVTIAAFGLAPVAFPEVRVRLKTPIGPLNWFLLVFFFQLVVDPVIVCFSGPFQNTLPFLPKPGAVNVALLVSLTAWVAFVAGCELAARWRPAAPRALVALLARPRPQISPNRLALAFALIGLVGIGLAFHSPRALLDYFRQAGGHVGVANTAGQSGLLKSASVALRPFLAFALVIPWCGWVDRRSADQRLIWRTLLVAVLVLVASATYSYNRGVTVAPVVGILAVYVARVMRVRLLVLVAVGVAALGLLTAARAYRNTSFTVAQVITSSRARHDILAKTSLSREIQVYTAAPQFLGFLLVRTGYGRNPAYGKTLVSSAMFPVPRLGARFRPASGVVIYNHLIYGPDTDVADQVVPFQGELFLDFTWPGVVVGYLLLGLLAARLQRAFERARSAFEALAWEYAAIWSAFLVIGSLAVFTQTALYFFWPLLVFALLRPRPKTAP